MPMDRELLALLIIMLSSTNEKPSRILPFIQQFLSVCLIQDTMLGVFMLSLQYPWGINPILQMWKQTQRD